MSCGNSQPTGTRVRSRCLLIWHWHAHCEYSGDLSEEVSVLFSTDLQGLRFSPPDQRTPEVAIRRTD
jgi:hypothetical protein